MKRFKSSHGKGRKGHKIRKKFNKSVLKTKAPNLYRGPMRGGIRF